MQVSCSIGLRDGSVAARCSATAALGGRSAKHENVVKVAKPHLFWSDVRQRLDSRNAARYRLSAAETHEYGMRKVAPPCCQVRRGPTSRARRRFPEFQERAEKRLSGRHDGTASIPKACWCLTRSQAPSRGGSSPPGTRCHWPGEAKTERCARERQGRGDAWRR